MIQNCKRCLLLEAGETKSFQTITSYINNLDNDLKVSNDEYNKRLLLCKNCDYLISGMCLKCGCYVEIRAILKNKTCANANNKKW